MMPPVALAGLPFLTRDPEPEPEPESELSVGMLCRVLPAAAVEAVLAMLSGTTERHGSSSLSEEQRQHAMQAVIAWGEMHLPVEQRVGFIDKGAKAGEACDEPTPLAWKEPQHD